MILKIFDKNNRTKINYSQCWEDTEVLLSALRPSASSVCLTIASGGENVLGLLSSAPRKVFAIDYNLDQLHLLELKAQSFACLEYQEMLEFLGVKSSVRRIALYQKCCSRLSPKAERYWNQRLALINKGVINIGKFERYLNLFQGYFLPLIHSAEDRKKLVSFSIGAELNRFYDDFWDNHRWKIIFNLFFSKFMMSRLGRETSYFNYVERSVSSKLIRERVKLGVLKNSPISNPYLHYLINGCYGEVLPFVYQERNFTNIRNNLAALELCHSTLDQFLSDANCQIDLANLSDVFEYLSPAEDSTLRQKVASKMSAQGRMVYWNFLVDRTKTISSFKLQEEESADLAERDKIFFYSKVLVEENLPC